MISKYRLQYTAARLCRGLVIPISLPAHCHRMSLPKIVHNDIRIVGEYETIDQNTPFFDDTIEALNIIKAVDARWCSRVNRTIRIIACRPMGFAAQYRSFKTCVVNHHYLLQEYPDPKQRIGNYCCMLVHEATHGVIENWGVPYVQGTYRRIESICNGEESRFAMHLFKRFPEMGRINIQPIDEQPYFRNWRNIIQFVKNHFADRRNR